MEDAKEEVTMYTKQSWLILFFALTTGLVLGTLAVQYPADELGFAQGTSRSVEAGSAESPKDLRSNLARVTGKDWILEQRIAASLQKVGKNLILEQTRGEKDIGLYRD